MTYSDLCFPFEDFVQFIQCHNIKPIDVPIDYLRFIHKCEEKEMIIRPEFYYGDTITAFNIEILDNATQDVKKYRWEVIY